MAEEYETGSTLYKKRDHEVTEEEHLVPTWD